MRGDKSSSKVAGRRIDELTLPRGAQIGAIVRGLPVPGETDLGDKRGNAAPEVIMAHHDTVIQTGDRVIVFIPSQQAGARGREAVPGLGHLLLTPWAVCFR